MIVGRIESMTVTDVSLVIVVISIFIFNWSIAQYCLFKCDRTYQTIYILFMAFGEFWTTILTKNHTSLFQLSILMTGFFFSFSSFNSLSMRFLSSMKCLNQAKCSTNESRIENALNCRIFDTIEYISWIERSLPLKHGEIVNGIVHIEWMLVNLYEAK